MNWNQIYGVGRGDAQVWQGNKGLEMLERQQLAEQKRRQAEEAELTADLSKLNYNEARDKDVPVFTEKLKDIKGMFARIRGARNNEERIKLTADYNDRKNEFLHSLRVSKEAKAQIAEAKKLRLSRADDLSDDYVPNLQTLDDTSTFDPKFSEYSERLMANPFRNKFDVIKFNKDIAPLVVDEVKGGIESRRVGNATVYSEKVGQQANPVKLKNLVVAQLNGGNKELTRYIRERYRDMPLPQAVDAFVSEQADGINSINKVTDKAIRTQEDEKPMTEYQRRSLAIREWDAANKANGITPETVRQDLVGRLIGRNQEARDIVQAQVEANPEFGGKSLVIKPNRDGTVIYEIPPKIGADGKIKQEGYTLKVIDNHPSTPAKINQLLNEITGEKIPYGNFKGIKGNKNKNPTPKANTTAAVNPKKNNPLDLDL